MGAKDKSPRVVSNTAGEKTQDIFRASAKVTQHCHMQKTLRRKDSATRGAQVHSGHPCNLSTHQDTGNTEPPFLGNAECCPTGSTQQQPLPSPPQPWFLLRRNTTNFHLLATSVLLSASVNHMLTRLLFLALGVSHVLPIMQKKDLVLCEPTHFS